MINNPPQQNPEGTPEKASSTPVELTPRSHVSFTESLSPGQQHEKTYFIYVLSDGSGETAANLARSLVTQFSQVQGIFIRRYAKVSDFETLDRILATIEQRQHAALIVYTLVNSKIRNYLTRQIKKRGFVGYDLFSNILTKMTEFFGTEPEENPDRFHGVNEQYFKRMEAVEYTMRNDDGKNLSDMEEADIVLVGVSRTGKTPLSVYLSLYGYKVINVPLVIGVEPPAALEQISQRKIIGLTIDPVRLMEIRKKRDIGLKVTQSEYSNPSAILDELEMVNAYFRKHRRWPVIDVTNRSIEETATLVRDKVFGRDRRVT